MSRQRITVPRPFPSGHTDSEMALIDAAMAQANESRRTVVSATGVPCHDGPRHYGQFGRLLYTLQCALVRDPDDWGWEIMPALSGGHLVGHWPGREAGSILHLRRWVQTGDEQLLLGLSWEPVWVPCLWQTAAEVGIANPGANDWAA